MNRTQTLTTIALGLGLLAGCRGGGLGIDDITPINTGEGGAGGMGGAGGEGGAVGNCDVPAPDGPACPQPGELPFDVEITGWQNAENESLDNPQNTYVYENTDVYGTPESITVGLGQMIRGGFISATGLGGETVSLWTWNANGRWDQLDIVTTDTEGTIGAYRYDLSGENAFPIGDHVAYAVLHADGTCAPHGIFSWPAGTRFIVTDIDGTMTLADSELTRQITDPSYVQVNNEGAPALLQAWAAKGYKVVYLTARPHSFRLLTRDWLELKGMPYGPVITAESLVFGASAREYKAAAISEMVNTFGWELVAAYGNADSDIEAYELAEHPKDRTFIIGELAGQSGTTAIPDQSFVQHISTYVNTQPDANQPADLVQRPFCRE